MTIDKYKLRGATNYAIPSTLKPVELYEYECLVYKLSPDGQMKFRGGYTLEDLKKMNECYLDRFEVRSIYETETTVYRLTEVGRTKFKKRGHLEDLNIGIDYFVEIIPCEKHNNQNFSVECE